MKQNDTIRWTSKDEQGEFSHVGVIQSINAKVVVFVTKKGTMAVPLNDGKFEVVEAGTEVAEEVKATVVVVESAPVSVKSGSKLEGAVAIVKANPDATRKQLIEMFVKQLGMTPAGASTYVYNAKQAVEKGA